MTSAASPSRGSSSRGSSSRAPIVAVAGLFVVVVAALVLTIAGAHVRPAGTSHLTTGLQRVKTPVLHLPTEQGTPPPRRHSNAATTSIGVLALIAGLVLILAVVAMALRLLLALLRSARIFRLRHRPEPIVVSSFAPDDVLRQMSDAVDDALDELAVDRPVSDSIIACWQRLGAAAAAVGIAPVPSDTPDEAIRRVFFGSEVSAGPLRALADLYREARFSWHSMGPDDVVAARQALTEILADLQPEASDALG